MLSVISTVTNLSILAVISMAIAGLNTTSLPAYYYILFLSLIAISFPISLYFQNKMSAASHETIFDLEISLIKKIRSSTFESFQRLGHEKIYASLGESWVLGKIPETLIGFFNSLVTVICGTAYLFWISPLAGAIITLFMVCLLIFNLNKDKKIAIDLKKVRRYQDSYYGSLYELMTGFKQIKVSDIRNDNLFKDHIFANRSISKTLTTKSLKLYNNLRLSGVYSWYAVLGLIVFFLPTVFNLSITQIASLITTILFLMAPASALLGAIPFYTQVQIAIERIKEIDDTLEVEVPCKSKNYNPHDFTSLRFENVAYCYEHTKGAFTLEIKDFSITRNEILFITGGNGSGKTTFLNIFTGLIKPSGGKVFLDDKEIGWDEFSDFSNAMAVVYTDHHLFNKNYDGHDLSENNKQLQFLKGLLGMDTIFKFDQSTNSIDTNLSKGQQKRLGLLLALLEDKPILVLDEWAAEQDPFNRNMFYTKWLDTIRAMGKTIIVISHDDDYYSNADRLLKFGYGKIVADNMRVTTSIN